jgi:hypothetical protein
MMYVKIEAAAETEFYLSFFSQGLLLTWIKLLGISNMDLV